MFIVQRVSLLIKGLTPNIISCPRPPPLPSILRNLSSGSSPRVSPPRIRALSLPRAARSIDLDGALYIFLHLHLARTARVPFISTPAQHLPFPRRPAWTPAQKKPSLLPRADNRPRDSPQRMFLRISDRLTCFVCVDSGAEDDDASSSPKQNTLSFVFPDSS